MRISWRTVPGNVVVPFVSDSFTDTAATALASHTPEVGGAITRHTNSTGSTVISDANRIRSGTSGQGDMHYYAATPPSADYTVEATIHVFSTLTNEISGPAGRINTGANTAYVVSYDQPTSKWALWKLVAGVRTILTSSATTVSLTTRDYRLKMVLVGSTQALYVDGVQVGTTQSDGAITAAGKVGVRFFTSGTMGNAATHHIDNLLAY